MSYQVLARKWRPRSFKDLVGQEHVVRTLTNALDNNRLHHAFLFTGTRGVGKTTISRIFAKALNCEQGVSALPCGECAPCREIDEGRFVDLIEVDAASRTKVEDTRELLDNVQYAPTRGRYKVYLIDEVHMLSTHSFNALLKTLEEPPPHVKFLLATTDPQRLPATILSRCLQFSLKRLSAALIAERLEAILAQEDIACEPSALRLIARAGEGSMRDALSLLDQAIAFGGGEVKQDAVSAMLGTLDQKQVLGLLDALANQDAAAALACVAELDQSAPDYAAVLAELISLLQQVALNQAVPQTPDDGITDIEAVQRLAAALEPEDVQLFYQIGLIGRRDLHLSPDPRSGFEMVLLRMLCFKPSSDATRPERQSTPIVTPSRKPAPPMSRPSTIPAAAIDPPAEPSPAATDADWSAIISELRLGGVAQQLALNCILQKREGNTFHLVMEPSFAMRTKGAEERLQAALREHFEAPIQLRIQTGELEQATPAQQQSKRQRERQQAAIETINHDPNVQALRKAFNAEVKTDSITPVDD